MRNVRATIAGRAAFWRKPTKPAAPEPFLGEDTTSTRTRGQLSMKYGHRNLIVAPDGLWAWFLLDGVDWPIQTMENRQTVITDQQHRLAELTGHRITMRGLLNPFPHQAYAARLYKDHPDRLPDVEGAQTWEEYVDAAQVYAISMDARRGAPVLGVRVATRAVDEHDLPKVLSRDALPQLHGEIEKVRLEYHRVAAVVARPGFGGKPLNAAALRWVVHASVGMGAPVPTVLMGGDPEGWTGDDVPGFTNPVYATEAPYGRTTILRTLRESEQYETHVAVLHADRFDPRDLDRPDLLPFLYWVQTLPQHVEYVATFDLVDGRDLKTAAERKRRLAVNIARHRAEHDDEPSQETLRGIDSARVTEDEVSNGSREVACRAHGVIMVAVTGATEEAACQVAADVTSEAARDQGITLVHDYGQYASYRSFTPGEPTSMAGHITRQPAGFLASAVPNATSAAGDPTGMILGPIAGSHDIFVFDPFGGPRRNKSGMFVIGGEQGCGKSNLAAGLADYTVRGGVRTVLFDPSGPWARLCELPHLRGNARHLSMSGSQRGILIPHRMIFDPRRQDFDDDAEHGMAVRSAEGERMALAVDTFLQLLPYRMVTTGDGAVEQIVTDAVTTVGGHFGVDPWEIVDRMKHLGDVGVRVAQTLTTAALTTNGGMIFPERGAKIDALDDALEQAALTVITMEGLTLPPAGQHDRSMWSRDALRSVTLVNLASRYATRTIYADRDPKMVLLDEIGVSTGGAASFSSFAVRASTDSRKWHAAIGLLFQNPRMLLDLDPQIANLIGSAFLGRMESKTALAGLTLLGLEEDSGYHHAVAGLDQGEFLVSDALGRVRKIGVDRAWWHQDLLDAVDTTAGGEGTYDTGDGDLTFGSL